MKNYWLDKKLHWNWIVTTPEVASIFETTFASFAPTPCETFARGDGMVWVRSADDWVWIKVPKTEMPIDAYTLEEHEELLARKKEE